MAILQSRMIALINAAIDYQQAYRQATKLVHDANNQVRQAPLSEQGELAKSLLLSLVLKTNDLSLLEDSAKSQATITGEHYRYSVNKKRNEWNREYQKKRRGGVTIKHHIMPDYATEDFNVPATRITPFRAKDQNQKGSIIPKEQIGYAPGELSDKTKEQINREIEKSLGGGIPKGEDFQVSDKIIDPNFPDEDKKEIVDFSKPKQDTQKPGMQKLLDDLKDL